MVSWFPTDHEHFLRAAVYEDVQSKLSEILLSQTQNVLLAPFSCFQHSNFKAKTFTCKRLHSTANKEEKYIYFQKAKLAVTSPQRPAILGR